MKIIKARFILRLNLLLGAIVGVLTGCGSSKKAVDRSGEIMAMYGIPMAHYQVSGTVRDADNHPVKGAQVVVKGYKNFAIGDTLLTDAQGKYSGKLEGWPNDSINIVVTDPKTQNADSVQVKVMYDEQKAWNSVTKPMEVNVRIKSND